MKRIFVISFFVLIALVSLFTIAMSKEDSPPFVGTWEATDIDGSNLWLWIEPGIKNIHYVTLIDERTGMICTNHAPIIFASAGLQVDTYELSTHSANAYCLEDSTRYAGTFSHGTYTYDPASDELCFMPGAYQICWQRSDEKKPEKVILGFK